MKLKTNLSTKSLQINKNQSAILIAVVIGTIVTVFCLTSAKVLLNQALYQRRVINARNSSAAQLNKDVTDAKSLANQYQTVFIGNDAQNVIGGSVKPGSNPQPSDGDNGKIVLDALPTSYDFPALLTSMSYLLNNDGLGAQSISGSDQATTVDNTPTYNPQPANINFELNGSTTYSGAKKLINDLEHSIRPFDITHLTLSGSESNLVVSLNITTYYQPAKTLSVPSKEIK